MTYNLKRNITFEVLFRYFKHNHAQIATKSFQVVFCNVLKNH
jgi:hypothetical protein